MKFAIMLVIVAVSLSAKAHDFEVQDQGEGQNYQSLRPTKINATTKLLLPRNQGVGVAPAPVSPPMQYFSAPSDKHNKNQEASLFQSCLSINDEFNGALNLCKWLFNHTAAYYKKNRDGNLELTSIRSSVLNGKTTVGDRPCKLEMMMVKSPMGESIFYDMKLTEFREFEIINEGKPTKSQEVRQKVDASGLLSLPKMTLSAATSVSYNSDWGEVSLYDEAIIKVGEDYRPQRQHYAVKVDFNTKSGAPMSARGYDLDLPKDSKPQITCNFNLGS